MIGVVRFLVLVVARLLVLVVVRILVLVVMGDALAHASSYVPMIALMAARVHVQADASIHVEVVALTAINSDDGLF